jgi:hypothetical protein
LQIHLRECRYSSGKEGKASHNIWGTHWEETMLNQIVSYEERVLDELE